jgi:small subunit ribosomal protein S9
MATKYLQNTVGKRKTAIARLNMKKGEGKITINGRSLEAYLIRPTSRVLIMQPFELTDNVGKFDIHIKVLGGGLSGQAGAIRHAIARALSKLDEANHKILKKAGLLTRDARKKERKLPGQPGARKRFQFSKR